MSAIADLRGLLAIVERSDWRELYLRTGDWTVFMARLGGGADPMMVESGDPDRNVDRLFGSNIRAISAPHIGTFTSALPIGSHVEKGAIVATLDLLGTEIEVRSDEQGRLYRILAEPNQLVEYGDLLIELTANAC